jgi:hypothetical protein
LWLDHWKFCPLLARFDPLFFVAFVFLSQLKTGALGWHRLLQSSCEKEDSEHSQRRGSLWSWLSWRNFNLILICCHTCCYIIPDNLMLSCRFQVLIYLSYFYNWLVKKNKWI